MTEESPYQSLECERLQEELKRRDKLLKDAHKRAEAHWIVLDEQAEFSEAYPWDIRKNALASIIAEFQRIHEELYPGEAT